MNFLLRRTALTAIRCSGFHRIAEFRTGGAGAILRLCHVRPRVRGRRGLMRGSEVTPRYLNRLVRMVKRSFDVVPMAEVPRRLEQARRGRRFAALTFDAADSDFLQHAAPILKRHGVPYTLYVTTGFIDGVVAPWWQALEEIVLKQSRLGLIIGGSEQSFDCADHDAKQILFDHIRNWMMTLSETDRDAAIRDLCKRYGFDLTSLNAKAMSWGDIVRLSADPSVTIGTSSVHHPVMAHLDETNVRREMKMGQAVAEAALGARPLHFAYPYGSKGTYGRREISLAGEADFATAVSGRARIVKMSDRDWLTALPRIPVDGRMQSVSALRVLMSGLVAAM
jgi:peptidoglycan/xylan/chitin deacetylase (PgdA/CDA1 family)